MSKNDFTIFLHRPACLVMLVMIAISVIYPIWQQRKHRRTASPQ
jgi:TctA family transporter